MIFKQQNYFNVPSNYLRFDRRFILGSEMCNDGLHVHKVHVLRVRDDPMSEQGLDDRQPREGNFVSLVVSLNERSHRILVIFNLLKKNY